MIALDDTLFHHSNRRSMATVTGKMITKTDILKDIIIGGPSMPSRTQNNF